MEYIKDRASGYLNCLKDAPPGTKLPRKLSLSVYRIGTYLTGTFSDPSSRCLWISVSFNGVISSMQIYTSNNCTDFLRNGKKLFSRNQHEWYWKLSKNNSPFSGSKISSFYFVQQWINPSKKLDMTWNHLDLYDITTSQQENYPKYQKLFVLFSVPLNNGDYTIVVMIDLFYLQYKCKHVNLVWEEKMMSIYHSAHKINWCDVYSLCVNIWNMMWLFMVFVDLHLDKAEVVKI